MLSNHTTDPQRAGEKMVEAVKSNVKLARKTQAVNLVEGLETRKVGTNAVEKVAKVLTEDKEKRNEGVVLKLMVIVKGLAKEKEKKARRKFQADKKEAEKLLPAGWIKKEFKRIMRKEVQDEWDDRKEKNKLKKDHLEKKYKVRKEEGKVKGIAVGDEELGEDTEEIKVLAYNVELSSDEQEYMKVPNSLTDFAPVDVEGIKTDIKAMEAKLRMSVREEEEQPARGLEDEAAARGLEDKEAEMASRRVYDESLRVADFRKKRVNDTGLNKRIKLPEPVAIQKETKIQSLVDDLEELAVKAGKGAAACLRAGKAGTGPGPPSSLTVAQQRGRASIKAREKAGELVLVCSDKSGKRAVMTPEVYKQLMEPHIRGDTIHTRDEVDQVEHRFNGASAQILKAFGVGKDWGHEDRLKSAYSACHNMVPSLSQLVKDHKETLKTRPVARARADQAPNGPLAALVGDILDPYIQEADVANRTEVISTEELCHVTEETNEKIRSEGLRTGPFQRAGKLVIGSKDAEAFYPNIDVDVAAEEAKLEKRFELSRLFSNAQDCYRLP